MCTDRTKTSKFLTLIFMFATILLLSACSANHTVLEFSFSSISPADHSAEKAIFINGDMDKLELDAQLDISNGNVTIEITDLSNGVVILSENYTEDNHFTIELADLKAQSEYSVKIQSVQTTEVSLTIITNEKLVKSKDKPKLAQIFHIL